MRVAGSYTYEDGSTIEVEISDAPLENFDPLRLHDMTHELRETLKLIIADASEETPETEATNDSADG